jgi:hypothetical protein
MYKRNILLYVEEEKKNYTLEITEEKKENKVRWLI